MTTYRPLASTIIYEPIATLRQCSVSTTCPLPLENGLRDNGLTLHSQYISLTGRTVISEWGCSSGGLEGKMQKEKLLLSFIHHHVGVARRIPFVAAPPLLKTSGGHKSRLLLCVWAPGPTLFALFTLSSDVK
jgi:hypothetical protein